MQFALILSSLFLSDLKADDQSKHLATHICILTLPMQVQCWHSKQPPLHNDASPTAGSIPGPRVLGAQRSRSCGWRSCFRGARIPALSSREWSSLACVYWWLTRGPGVCLCAWGLLACLCVCLPAQVCTCFYPPNKPCKHAHTQVSFIAELVAQLQKVCSALTKAYHQVRQIVLNAFCNCSPRADAVSLNSQSPPLLKYQTLSTLHPTGTPRCQHRSPPALSREQLVKALCFLPAHGAAAFDQASTPSAERGGLLMANCEITFPLKGSSSHTLHLDPQHCSVSPCAPQVAALTREEATLQARQSACSDALQQLDFLSLRILLPGEI